MNDDPYIELQAIARLRWDTTPGDVINAFRAGTLEGADVESFVRMAEEKLPANHPELTDDDPDNYLGWKMGPDGEPIPEVR